MNQRKKPTEDVGYELITRNLELRGRPEEQDIL